MMRALTSRCEFFGGPWAGEEREIRETVIELLVCENGDAMFAPCADITPEPAPAIKIGRYVRYRGNRFYWQGEQGR